VSSEVDFRIHKSRFDKIVRLLTAGYSKTCSFALILDSIIGLDFFPTAEGNGEKFVDLSTI
jgi:hypothetical protein